jgi:hypothetical protein
MKLFLALLLAFVALFAVALADNVSAFSKRIRLT